MLENHSTQAQPATPRNAPIWYLVDGHMVYGVPPRPWWRTTADVLDDDRDILVDELSFWWVR